MKPGMEIAELVRSVCPDPSLRFELFANKSRDVPFKADK